MEQKLTGIPETLLIALWARATATQKPSPLICDPKAVEMVEAIDYDFSRFENVGKLTTMGVAVRTMILDREFSRIMDQYQSPVVINLGTGLDTRHSRLSCDEMDWYEVDVAEAIALRRRFFTETDKYHFIAKSILDRSWMDEVETGGRPVIFLAEGLFMYFDESDLRPFFCDLVERFPIADMLFEMLCPIAVGNSKKHETVKQLENPPEFKWGLRNTRKMESWHPGIRLCQEWNYFDEQKKDWGLIGRLGRLPLIRPTLACRIVQLRFDRQQ
ncbi:MAG: methyltransferase [Planctomycetota bacterium]|nr:MAG: methyltransferase [Planctomycetota bacterium]